MSFKTASTTFNAHADGELQSKLRARFQVILKTQNQVV